MKRKALSLVLALVLCLTCALPAFAAGSKTSRFTDVDPNAWYAEAINALADGGILSGKGDGIFDPNGKITLAELAVIITRMEGGSVGNDQHWAGEAMCNCGFGIDRNMEETDPLYCSENVAYYKYANDYAYRGDAISMFGLYARLFSGEDANEVINNFDESIIPDKDEYSAKMIKIERITSGPAMYGYKDYGHNMNTHYIDYAYYFGVTTGMDENHTCAPFNTLTRAEVAQMCYNMGWTTAGCLAGF